MADRYTHALHVEMETSDDVTGAFDVLRNTGGHTCETHVVWADDGNPDGETIGVTISSDRPHVPILDELDGDEWRALEYEGKRGDLYASLFAQVMAADVPDA